jgi:hypothetical protein
MKGMGRSGKPSFTSSRWMNGTWSTHQARISTSANVLWSMKGMVWLLIENTILVKSTFSLASAASNVWNVKRRNSDHTSRRSREGQAVLVDEIGLQSADVGGVQVAVVKQHLRYVPDDFSPGYVPSRLMTISPGVAVVPAVVLVPSSCPALMRP